MDNTPAVSMHIPLALVFPNPEQPRKIFDQAALEELAASIREHGVIEPIIVEQHPDGYMLHGGERRTQAARLAGLVDIPAVVHPSLNGTGPQTRLERALIENVQRVDMTPLEEARGYLRLRNDFGLTIPQIIQRIGKSRTHILRLLRLMELEPAIQVFIEQSLLPHDDRAVQAMLSIPAGEPRIKFCSALAKRNPSIKVTVEACQKFKAHTEELVRQAALARKEKEKMVSPAIEIATRHVELRRPDWDVWKQIGALPAWSLLRETATATCDACAIRAVASDANCRDCPLVECLRRTIGASHASPTKRK